MKHRKIIWIILIVVVLASGAAAGWWLYRRYWSEQIVPSAQLYPTRGVDLSAHNGRVDFKALADSGVDFVILKATEGVTFVDNMFFDNYRDARDAGLRVGAYHFFRFDCDGRQQAFHLLHNLAGRQVDFPLILDIEESGNASEYDPAQVDRQLSNAIEHLQLRGYQVMLYTNKDGYRDWVKGRHDDLPLWICSFTDPPIDAPWSIWQYTHRGTVPGVKGSVDLNVLNP